jgi:hypothetical protein
VGAGAQQGNCIDAYGNSLINQTPQCNAANFYRLANAEIAQGTLTVPPAGTGQDGQACQTTRDFALIDQDQSDNAVASYLFDPATGQSAQATADNTAAMANATVETNGSDNGLLDKFVDPALGCTPFTAPNPTNPNGSSASQALNELSARQNQTGTIALLPVSNPQLLVGGNFSIGKTNAYRAERQQPGHLPRGPAERLVRQPELPELRPDRPGHADNRRERRGDRRDVQHRAADRHGHRHHAGRPPRPRRRRRWQPRQLHDGQARAHVAR